MSVRKVKVIEDQVTSLVEFAATIGSTNLRFACAV